jgi:hypothetical protein
LETATKEARATDAIPEHWEHSGQKYPALILLNVGVYIRDVLGDNEAYEFVRKLNIESIREIKSKPGGRLW